MKPRITRSILSIFFAFLFLLLFSSCQVPAARSELASATSGSLPSQTPTVSFTPNATRTAYSGYYLTQTARPTRTPSKTPTASSTPTVTPTPSPTMPQIGAIAENASAPLFASPAVPFEEGNLPAINRMVQWGKGSILRMAFSADGKSLLAGSAFGIAIYSVQPFATIPTWRSFETALYFDLMEVSQEGNLVRLSWDRAYPASGRESRVFNLTAGEFESEERDVDWLPTMRNEEARYSGMGMTSTDGRLRLKTDSSFWEEGFPHGRFMATIYNNSSGKELTKLQQETLFVRYDDHSTPDGCDLSTFSYCGNVYDPSIMLPYRAAFSSSGKTLAILYRSANMWYSHAFSLLRVYSTHDGSLITGFGSFDQPVEDFAYQPGSDRIAVAFISGSIQIWEPAQEQLIHQVWDFRSTVLDAAYSQDGRYLILQYADAVEVLKADSGAVLGRYEASTFALSPRENLLALGSQQGEVQVEDLDQRRTVSRMIGHSAVIYAMVFSPDGLTLTSSSEDCTVRNWDAHTGQFLHYFEEVSVDAIGEGWTESRIFVYYMAFVPGRNQMVGFGSWGTAASWDAQSGAKQFEIVSKPLEYYNGLQTLNPHFPASIWIAPEENRFFIEASSYDLGSGEISGVYQPPENLPEECSPVGPLLIDNELRFTIGYGSLSGQVCVLKEKDHKLIYRIPIFSAHDGETVTIRQIYLSPDSSLLYIVSQAGPIFVYRVGPAE